MENESRGTLYPARLPTLHRLAAPAEISGLVRWFWIPEWDIAPGRVSRQELLPFAACNLVVDPGFVGFSGPPTQRSFRDLEGRGWAVGALLRPAAVPYFVARPSEVRDTTAEFNAPDLRVAVTAAMTADRDGETYRGEAVSAFSAWIVENIGAPTPSGSIGNAMADLIDTDPSITRVEHIADRLSMSVRTVQRLAERYFGLPPLTLIRRRRLQEAAELLRTEPGTSVAAIASELGYADHAHLANEFRDALGFTASRYRRSNPGGRGF
ncbi:helix-turn-helix domain-containing protein [Leifsonia kafniensis]|uniref:Helix-turn-helix domain-containing protein n=1 Tax=Leifsonia kafniensis TaxID=475957 RepID=A0ABP7KEY2_9MICO